MIDPKDFDLPLEEMSFGSKAPAPVLASWRKLLTYRKETHPTFHTSEDYHAAVRLFTFGYPKVRDIVHDQSKN